MPAHQSNASSSRVLMSHLGMELCDQVLFVGFDVDP